MHAMYALAPCYLSCSAEAGVWPLTKGYVNKTSSPPISPHVHQEWTYLGPLPVLCHYDYAIHTLFDDFEIWSHN